MSNEAKTETVTALLVDLAKSNAAMALDQRAAHPSLEDAICSYYDNVRDSLIEQAGSHLLGASWSAFRDAVRVEAGRLGLSLDGTSCEMPK